MIELGRIVEIVTDWASDDSDGIDDLDALCQIAEVLGIEVEARTPSLVEAPRCKCGADKDDPIHSCSTEFQPMHKFE